MQSDARERVHLFAGISVEGRALQRIDVGRLIGDGAKVRLFAQVVVVIFSVCQRTLGAEVGLAPGVEVCECAKSTLVLKRHEGRRVAWHGAENNRASGSVSPLLSTMKLPTSGLRPPRPRLKSILYTDVTCP